jgi:hypothetical protein
VTGSKRRGAAAGVRAEADEMAQPLEGGALYLSDVLREASCGQADLFNAVHAANESM